MKQIAQNYRTGELTLLDAPVPGCRPGGVLVRTEFSLISPGTELMKVGEAELSLLGKARARPDQVRRVLDTVAQQGPRATYRKVMHKLDTYSPLGYSLCGQVIEVGDGVTDLSVGDRVASAGNQFATHAEVNWVPSKMCARVPDGVQPAHAAFTTIGAIALQGIRQAEVGLGEVAAVIGLGLVGQVLVRLLDASGVRVVGADPIAERCDLAVAGGAAFAADPSDAGGEQVLAAARGLTRGFGVDSVFLCATGQSNAPVELAAELSRDRGRVVDIGKCSLDLPWNAFYEKELEVRFSRSYGPGRYDPIYEERGIDYPIGYVRWTEGRHLECFLDLLAQGRVEVEPLVSKVTPFGLAVEMYEQLSAGEAEGVGYLFEYPADVVIERRVSRPRPTGTVAPTTARLGIGFIGAGSYATTMLLPHLKDRPDVELVHVATAGQLSALSAQRKFGFEHASTDHTSVLADPRVDGVFIATRHHSHAALVDEALRAGKAVFVEKPLALNQEQLQAVVSAVDETGNGRLQVGFNRRFSPMLISLRERFGTVVRPSVGRYLVNAGTVDRSSWYADTEKEGSRFVGEGGHFIDTFGWWFGSLPASVHATPLGGGDGVEVTLTFEDGSVGTITYTTLRSARSAKETFEVIAEGRVARLEDFRSATLWAGRRRRRWRSGLFVDKGQRGEIDAFLTALRSGGPMPVSLDAIVSTTDATLAVPEGLATGETVKLTSSLR